MEEFKAFPPSLNLSSGTYYICGVDICEEGLQFCNAIDRRCEYCADRHYECFTYIQQQNCTLYCQDQWLMNQLERSKKQSVISGSDISQCQEYKTLTIVLGVLLFIIFLSMVYCVVRIRKCRKNLMKAVLPDFCSCENISRKRKNATTLRNRQPRTSYGSGIEDQDAMEGLEIGNDILEQGPQNELNTCLKSNFAQVYNNSESPGTMYSNIPASENDAKIKANVGKRTNYKTSGHFSQEEKKTNGLEEKEVGIKYETEESKQSFQRFNNPVARTVDLMGQSKATQPKSYNRTQGNGIQTNNPHGELSTMPSHGDYPAMVHSPH